MVIEVESRQEVGNTPEAQFVLNQLQKRISRVGADTQPVADEEIYEVIRCRLFEGLGDASVIEACATNYMDWYQKHKTELPGNATKSEYKQKILKAYPFHPELIDVFRVRWASHHDFQRTRGALRLLAGIVSDLFCPARPSFAPQQMPCSAPRLCLLTKRSKRAMLKQTKSTLYGFLVACLKGAWSKDTSAALGMEFWGMQGGRPREAEPAHP